MNKTEFIAKIHSARQEWEGVLASLTGAPMLQPKTCGDWSVKDVIAHVAWYEREMVNLLEAHALVGSDLWDLPLEQRNAAIYAVNRDRPLRDVLAEAVLVSQDLLRLLPTLSEADLTDATRFPGMPLDWVPWEVIASNTLEHYSDHLTDIRTLLDK
jgi:hypothetical protein